MHVGTKQRCIRDSEGAKIACCSVQCCAGGIQRKMGEAEVFVCVWGTDLWGVQRCVAEYTDVLGRVDMCWGVLRCAGE